MAHARIGMHTSLWTAEWTRESAELAVSEAAEHKLEVLEIALLSPTSIDAPHSRKLFEKHGIAPSGSLCLPLDQTAALAPEKAERFLMAALEKGHELGCKILGGLTY